MVAKNEAGSGALTTYVLAQCLSKRPETAYLAPHVADMRRVLNRSRRAKAAAERRKTKRLTLPTTPTTTDYEPA